MADAPQRQRRIEWLRDQILKAKQAYYYGTPIMSDQEYDALEEQLESLAPGDPVLAMVGAPVQERTEPE